MYTFVLIKETLPPHGSGALVRIKGAEAPRCHGWCLQHAKQELVPKRVGYNLKDKVSHKYDGYGGTHV